MTNLPDQVLAFLAGSDLVVKGPPTLKTYTIADPAANTELSISVPTGKLWELKSFSVPLVQGTTQTPLPVLVWDDGTTTHVLGGIPGASAVVSASITTRMTWAVGVPGATAGAGAAANYAPLPNKLLLGSGWTLRTLTTGIGANTDYGLAALAVAEYAV